MVLQKGFDEIHISAEGGDGQYSIGHLVLIEGDNTSKTAPFFLDQDQSGGFAQFVSTIFTGSRIAKPSVPELGLDEPCLGVYITLRVNGKLRDFTWSGMGTVLDCLTAGIRKIRQRSAPSATESHRILEVWIILAEYPVNLRRPGRALSNAHRGIHGLRLEYKGKMSRFSPTEMIALNLSFEKALEIYQRRNGITRWQMLINARTWTSEGVQMIVNLDDVPEILWMERGNNLVIPEALSMESVSNMGALMGEWLVHQVHPDGRMTYTYLPNRGIEPRVNNMVRQWMASLALIRLAHAQNNRHLFTLAEKNISYNLSRYYREENGLGLIEWNGKVKLGAIALATLALVELPTRYKFSRYEKALMNTIEALYQKDGSFSTFYKPRNRVDNQNFYPGETLLLWAVLYRESKDQELLGRFMKSFRYYRSWHRAHRNSAFIPWHTQAYYLLWSETHDPELRDFIFEMNDWLLGMQQWDDPPYPDMQGRFFDPERVRFGQPHASSTGVYLEGLIDAWALAKVTGDTRRQEAYRLAIVHSLRWVMQLQFVDEVDMFYVSRQARVRGGLRPTVYDNTIRVDNVQHNLMAVLKILSVFGSEDYHY
jgi:hypothetical protein